jgi:hypothetical protein
MKRTASDCVKLWRLCRLLKIERYEAVGILECVWHFTAKNAPAGNIGEAAADEELARWIGWKGDPKALIAALVEAGWIDRHDDERLVVHDWYEHCEDSIHSQLARAGMRFWDGQEPKPYKLSADEKRKLSEKYGFWKDEVAAAAGRQPKRRRPAAEKQPAAAARRPSLPSPSLPSPSMPIQSPAQPDAAADGRKPGAGVFADVTTDTLRDNAKLQAWYEMATSLPNPVVRASERNRLNVFAAARRALEVGNNPPALFASIVASGDGPNGWQLLTVAHEEKARQQLRDLDERANYGGRLPRGSAGSEPETLAAAVAEIVKKNGHA